MPAPASSVPSPLPLALFLLLGVVAAAVGREVTFKHTCLDPAFRSEGVAVADLDQDGRLEIFTGNVLYKGPDWKMQPLFGEAKAFDPEGYSDAFLCFADDIDGDGWLDLIVVGFPGQKSWWLKNPGKAGGEWVRYDAIEQTGQESPYWTDVDGDGRNELVFTSEQGVGYARPGDDPTALWPIHVIGGPDDPRPGHGLGVGDLNGDGRADILCPDGWWEAPADRTKAPWPFHRAKLSEACAQMQVMDVDGDGDADIISSSAHGYGIWWTEQTADGWVMHEIDKTYSQTHAVELVDLDGDGLLDFVTGKRRWAHRHEPGSDDPSLLCWYRLQRQDGKATWTKHPIDDDSGVGLHFVVIDLNGDGLPDIVTSNKKGVHIFVQEPR